MIDKDIFGQYVAKRRREMDMTQSMLAEKLNISFQAVSKWERGISIPDSETINRIAKVLDIKEGLFTFEAASRFSLPELIRDVNEKGITTSNYISLGALLLSEGFTLKIVTKFTNPIIRETLIEMLESRDLWEKKSLIALSHYFCDRFASRIDSTEMVSKLNKVNGVLTCAIQSNENYPYFIMTKLLRQIANNHKPSTLMTMNEDTDSGSMQIQIVCSDGIAEDGYNCYYLSDLIRATIFQSKVVAGTSGGGNEQHASIIIHQNDRRALKTDAFHQAQRLFMQYLHCFNKPFEIEIVESTREGN